MQFEGVSLADLRSLVILLYCQPGQWAELAIPEHGTAWAWLRSLFRLYAVTDTR